MDEKRIAEDILEALGGKENISSNFTCMTRLRVKLKNDIDVKKLKTIEGVLNVVDAETLQIVLGPGVVNRVGNEFSKLTGLPLGFEDVKEVAKENKKTNKSKHDGPVQKFLQKIANIFVPLLPGIIAAGLILGLSNVINVTTKGALLGDWWFQAIRTIGYGMFTFLAIYVGMNSSKEFGGTPILGGIIGALFIGHPGNPLLAKINDAGIILPLTEHVPIN